MNPDGAVQILTWADVATKSNYRQRFAEAARRAGEMLKQIAIKKGLVWPLAGLWLDEWGIPDTDPRFRRDCLHTFFLLSDGSSATACVRLDWLPPAPIFTQN